MSKCNKYKKNIVLNFYNDLDDYNKADLDAHLLICSSCRQEYENLEKMSVIFNDNYSTEPDENTLKALRNVTEIKIRKSSRNNQQPGFKFLPWPVYQFAVIVLMLGIGFFAGRTTQVNIQPDKQSDDLKSLISAERNVQYSNSTIDPYMMNINRLKFNQDAGTVSINYNTVNDIDVSASLEDPLVKELLLYAMNYGDNTNVRMHAVKAISAIAENNNNLDDKFLQSIKKTLHNEENSGVRLFALRVLSSMTLNENVKRILIHVLLYDANPALRIESFKILTSEKITVSDIEMYLEPAQSDSNSFISNQSKTFINQLLNEQTKENGPFELARRSQP